MVRIKPPTDKSFLVLFFKKGLLASFLLLASCDRHPAATRAAQTTAGEPQQKTWFQGAPPAKPGLHLAYLHEVTLAIAGGALPAHFTAARDRCLGTPALHCLLLHAELTPDTATLHVRLPHDQVAGFAESLTQALPGEAPGLVHVTRQATTAEDLGRPIADVAQRVAQLQDYLASLKALGSRLTISVSDLVKIAGETAQAQSQIEEVQAQQRELAMRVDTEELDVDFQVQAPTPVAVDPVDQVWAGSQGIWRDNLAASLTFAIAALPWVPVGFVGLVVLWFARRLVIGGRR